MGSTRAFMYDARMPRRFLFNGISQMVHTHHIAGKFRAHSYHSVPSLLYQVSTVWEAVYEKTVDVTAHVETVKQRSVLENHVTST